MDESELLRRLDRLAGVEPPPEMTERAAARVRAALVATPGPGRGRRIIPRFAAVAAALALVVALGVFLAAPSGAGRAFADVQDKVKRSRSITMRFSAREGDGPVKAGVAYALADGRLRVEDANGGYQVVDPKAEVMLAVNPAAKEALLIRGHFNRVPTDVYRLFREVRKDEVRRFPREHVAGRSAEVFVARVKLGEVAQEVKVWVDAESQLPFRIEMTHPDPDAKQEVRTLIDLEFDRPLNEKLFSTEPPAGYKVRREGTDKPAPPTGDAAKLAPVLTPKEGIGPVKFGMTKKEVIDKLGEPDQVDNFGTTLSYLSRGYSIAVGRRGVMTIQCHTQATFAVKVKDFAGRTREGIAMGASSADIVRAYGEPESRETLEGTTTLDYRKKLGMQFILYGEKLVSIWMQAW